MVQKKSIKLLIVDKCVQQMAGNRTKQAGNREIPAFFMPKYNDRKSSAQRGYGYKWQQAREKFLAENPFCEDHKRLGRDVLATVVDHKIPHRGDMKLFWDRKNWQALCKPCHDSHKQREELGSMAAGCDKNGIPLSKNHHWTSRGAG